MPPDDVSSRARASARVEGPFVLLLLITVAVWRLYHFFRSIPIRAPYQYDYEEGNILNAISRILDGSTPYPDPHALPNVINPYGPAAYYVLAIPAKLFGLTFFYPRALILICTVLIAVLIAVQLRRITKSLSVGIAFALIFLCIPNIQEWAWLLRVDLLGILFTTAGLVTFESEPLHTYRNDQNDKSFRARASGQGEEPAFSLIVPAIFFASAILVKPTLIAAPAACLVSAAVNRKSRVDNQKLLTFAGVIAVACALALGIFALVTRGAVITDIFFSHPDPFDFHAYTEWLSRMIMTAWPLVILAVIAIARYRTSPAVCWMVFATLAAATAGKLGSNRNHFLEWNTALCLCAGLGFAELLQISRRSLAIWAGAAAGACIVIALVTWPRLVVDSRGQSGCAEAYDWVRDQAGANVLSENVGAVVMAKKTVWVSNPFVLTQLVEHAGWSDAALVTMIRQRYFDAILTRMNYPQIPSLLAQGTERFSPEVVRAIGESYEARPGFVCADMNMVFVPK